MASGNSIDIEIFKEGGWQKAASFELLSKGEERKGTRAARGFVSYDVAYAVENDGNPAAAVSCRYPVDPGIHRSAGWPAFLVDMLPGGAGRRHYVVQDGVPDGPAGDWHLIQVGAGNPPGNLRVAHGAIPHPEMHEGFDRREIIEHGPEFAEYARNAGAAVNGAADVQGDSPKFLLTQDARGRWHSDGVLPDTAAQKHWLVKFPRGMAKSDRAVLRYEAIYLQVAREVGIRVAELSQYEDDTLFVPRFDRAITSRGVERIGMESLCSLCGVNGFGVKLAQEELCKALHDCSSSPQRDIEEFVLRDVLNVALGNTDNHGRNHAVLRRSNGIVELSPLFDFAPMVLDDDGIARACRWDAEDAGRPRWGEVAETLGLFVDSEGLRRRLKAFAPQVLWLINRLRTLGARDDLMRHVEMRAVGVARALEKIKC